MADFLGDRYRYYHLLLLTLLYLLPLVVSRCISNNERNLYVNAKTDKWCPAKCTCSYNPVRFHRPTVDCSARQLTAVPDHLPENTEKLILRENNIKSLLDHDLANCTHLQTLDLAGNDINHLSRNAFVSTESLYKLMLNDNNISVFSLPSDTFAKLRKLNTLYLQNNIWKNARNYSDPLIAPLSKLERLMIDGLPGVPFTPGFSRLTNLLRLSVHGGLDIITNDTFAVFSNSSLTNLFVSSATLYEVHPLSFAHFRNLVKLDLSYNTGLGLLNVSRAWFGLQFTHITKLFLTRIIADSVGATSVTSEFFTYLNLTKITVLKLGGNSIVDIEPELSKSLRYLQRLDISYNRLSNAASLIFDLWKLRHLLRFYGGHQVKRYLDPPETIAAEQPNSFVASSGNLNDDSSGSKNDFFQHCKTPPLKPCLFEAHHDSKFPLPLYGTWCLPAPPKIEYLILIESLTVNYKNIPPIILFGGSHLKLLVYRLNGLEKLLGPLIVTQPMKDVVFDFSDNRISCIAPDALNITAMFGSVIAEIDLHGNKLATQMEVDVSGITFKNLAHLSKLNLANNGIKRIAAGVFSQLLNMTVLNVSQNALRKLDFEFSHMKMLQTFDLSYNLLTSLSKATLEKFSALMEMSNLTLNLLGNPLQCSCETYYFLEWIDQHRKQLMNFDNYTCLYKDNVVQFSNLTKGVMIDLNFQCSKHIVVIVSASLLGLVVILIGIAICCYRYRWELRYFCLKLAQRSRRYQLLVDDETYTYDAFVVYSCEDGQWVNYELVPHLENSNDDQPLHLCVHERDFLPGENIIGNIWSKMEESRKVILVISNNFTKSNYCNYEIDLARMLSVEKARNMLVPVMLETVRMKDMSNSLQWIVRKLTYIEWPQWEPDREEFWKRLRNTIVETADYELAPSA